MFNTVRIANVCKNVPLLLKLADFFPPSGYFIHALCVYGSYLITNDKSKNNFFVVD